MFVFIPDNVVQHEASVYFYRKILLDIDYNNISGAYHILFSYAKTRISCSYTTDHTCYTEIFLYLYNSDIIN